MKNMRLILLIIGGFSLFYAHSQNREVSQEEAFEYVSNLFEGRKVDYYSAFNRNDSCCVEWIFFVDADPNAFWGHECYMISYPKFISNLNEIVPKVEQYDFPPRDYIRKPYLVKNRKISTDINRIVVPKKFGQRKKTLFGTTQNTYVIIFSGNEQIIDNTPHFWNDCAFFYQTLINRYDVPKENIRVLIADGTDPSGDIYGPDEIIYSSPLDLDYDGVDDIQYAANRENLKFVVDELSQILSAGDQLLLFITCHGGPLDIENKADSFFCLFYPEDRKYVNTRMEARELKTILAPLYNKDIAINIVIGSCSSGGFVERFSDTRSVVASASERHKPAYATLRYNYNYYCPLNFRRQ